MPLAPVGDIELNYDLIDCTEPWKAGRAPVVFLHGLGGHRGFWLFQIPTFCSTFPTMTVDLRGHGLSSKPAADWTIADMALDLARLLRRLGVERAHVVGVSMGGMVAQQFALDYPYATASLVLVDTMCGIPREHEKEAREAIRFIEDNPMGVVARQRITNAFSERADPLMRDYFVGQVAKNDKAAYVRAARATWGFSSAERLGEIGAPSLVVVGDQDRVTPPVLSEEIASRIRDARLTRIPDAGHMTNLEQPEEFNQIVLGFLLALE